jgi:hypothetical protein
MTLKRNIHIDLRASTTSSPPTMMQADDDVYNADTEFEAETPHPQRRRSSIKKSKMLLNLVPNFDWSNLACVLLFYLCFYSFLCGFYLLLLEGVTSTSVDGQHTLLWTFFYLGIVFTFVVSATTYASQWEEKKKIDLSITNASSRRSSASLVESKRSALLDEPPPPPATGDSHGTTTSDDLDDVELLSEAKTTIEHSGHVGDVEVS